MLPIEANLGYMRDVSQARAMVTECVRQRMQEVDKAGGLGEPQAPGRPSDLLTLILEERQAFKGSEDELTEEEIVNQVSPPAFTRKGPGKCDKLVVDMR